MGTLISKRAEMDTPPLDPTELLFLMAEPRLSSTELLMPTVEMLLRSPMRESPPMDLLQSRLPTLLLPTALWLPMLLLLLLMLLLLPTVPSLPTLPLLLPMLPSLLLIPPSSMVKLILHEKLFN